MENNYSIEEILNAINDLQNIKKNKINKLNIGEIKKIDNSNIPVNTLKLIEEAEKSNN